jgi:hypothetical protein
VPQLKRLKLVLTLETLGTQKQLTAAAAAALAQQQGQGPDQGQGQGERAAAAAEPPVAAAASLTSKQQQGAAALESSEGFAVVGGVRDAMSSSHLVMAGAAAVNTGKGRAGDGAGIGAAAAEAAVAALERRLQLLLKLQQQARDLLLALEENRKGNSQMTGSSLASSAAAGSAGEGLESNLQQGAAAAAFGGGGVEGGLVEGGESTIAVLGSDGGSVAPSIATASVVASPPGSVVEATTVPTAAAAGAGRDRSGSGSAIAASARGSGGSPGSATGEGRGFRAHRLLRRRSGRRRGGGSGAVQEVSDSSMALEQPVEQPLLSLESFVPARTISALHQAIKALVKCSTLSKKQQEANAAAAAGLGALAGGPSSRLGRRVGDGDGVTSVTGQGSGLGVTSEGLGSLLPLMSPALGTAGAVVPQFTFSQGALWAEQEHSLSLLKSCLQSIEACITLGQQVLEHLAAAGSDNAALERLLPSALEGLDDRLFALSTGMMLPHTLTPSGFGLGLNRVSPISAGSRGMHAATGWGSAALGTGGLVGGEEPVRLQLLPRNNGSNNLAGMGGRGVGGASGWVVPGAPQRPVLAEQHSSVLEDELGLLLGRSLRTASASDRGGTGVDGSPVSVEWRLMDRGTTPSGTLVPLHDFGAGSSSGSGRISFSRRSQDGLGDRGGSSSTSNSRRGVRHRHRHSNRGSQSSTVMSRERYLPLSSTSLNPMGSRLLPGGQLLRHQVTPLYDPTDLPGRHQVTNHHHIHHRQHSRGSGGSASSSSRGRVWLMQSLNPNVADAGEDLGLVGQRSASLPASSGAALAGASSAAPTTGSQVEEFSFVPYRSIRIGGQESSGNAPQQQQWQQLLPEVGGSSMPGNPLNPEEVVVAGTLSNANEDVPQAPVQVPQGEVDERRNFYTGTNRGWSFFLRHLPRTAASNPVEPGRSPHAAAAAGAAGSSSSNQGGSNGAEEAAPLSAEHSPLENGAPGVVETRPRVLDAGAAVAEVLRGSRALGERPPHGLMYSSSSGVNRLHSSSPAAPALQVPVTPPSHQQGVVTAGVRPSSLVPTRTDAIADSLVSELSSVELASARSNLHAESDEDVADVSGGGGNIPDREVRPGAAGSRSVADERPSPQQQQVVSSSPSSAGVAGAVAAAGRDAPRGVVWRVAPAEISVAALEPAVRRDRGSNGSAGHCLNAPAVATAGGSGQSVALGSSNTSRYLGNAAAAGGGKVKKCMGEKGDDAGRGLGGLDADDRKQRLLAYNAAAGAATDGSLAEEEAGTCPICMDRPVALQVSSCSHGLCLVCAFQLCSKGRNAPLCPFCRQTIGDFEAAAAGTI